jgi:hypothetical protein
MNSATLRRRRANSIMLPPSSILGECAGIRRPFPSFASSYNGANASYPDPASAWQSKDAQPYFNATYEAADQGQRLVADLNLVAVPYPAQVRRLMYAYVEEERRFRRHDLTLPPDFARLEPLDALTWTSPGNGYTDKVFEIAGVTEDLLTGLQALILKERDPDDYSYPELAAPPEISVLPVLPAVQTLPGFAVSGASIPDASGTARRPALVMTWSADLPDVTGIFWEARVQATGVVVARGSTHDVAAGTLIISEGILPSTVYQVRAQPVVDRPSDWTAWTAATTPATLLLRPDLAIGSVTDRFEVYVPGPILANDTPTGTVLLTYNHGPVNVGEIWRRAFVCELSNTLASDVSSNQMKVRLETRRKPYGLPYSAWEEVVTFNAPYVSEFGTNVWNPFSSTGSIAERLEDIQYRVVCAFRTSTWNPTKTWIKEINFAVAEVTR